MARRGSPRRSSGVYVGDAVVDIRAAQAAGMPSIAVTWGAGARDDLVAAGPDHVIDDVAALHAVVGVISGVAGCPAGGRFSGSSRPVVISVTVGAGAPFAASAGSQGQPAIRDIQGRLIHGANCALPR